VRKIGSHNPGNGGVGESKNRCFSALPIVIDVERQVKPLAQSMVKVLANEKLKCRKSFTMISNKESRILGGEKYLIQVIGRIEMGLDSD
jgi:hypothetical protein